MAENTEPNSTNVKDIVTFERLSRYHDKVKGKVAQLEQKSSAYEKDIKDTLLLDFGGAYEEENFAFSQEQWEHNGVDLYEKGVVDANGNLTDAYDAICKYYGSNKYRIPTKEEWLELALNCDITADRLDYETAEMNGIVIKSRINGKELYIEWEHYVPAFTDFNTNGLYRFSCRTKDNVAEITDDTIWFSLTIPMYSGVAVLPIADADVDDDDFVDLGLSVKWGRWIMGWCAFGGELKDIDYTLHEWSTVKHWTPEDRARVGHKVLLKNHQPEYSSPIEPNVMHVWGEVQSLNITLAPPTDNTMLNEYMIRFESGATPTRLTLPASVKFPNDLLIEANKTYEINIANNIGLFVCV